MSEKIYACLLRLYPSSFRRAYGEQALQLFRDRTRDEQGLLSGLRLWLDLLCDLAISLPREYRPVSGAIAVSQAQQACEGTPSFHILDTEALSLRSLFYGGVASLLIYGSILVLVGLLGYGGNPLANPALDSQRLPRPTETIAKRPPTVTLTSLPARPTPGAVVSLTAKVFAVGGTTPTGSVRFFDASGLLTTRELNDGTVTVKVRLFREAAPSLRATYLGDAKYSSASSVAQRD